MSWTDLDVYDTAIAIDQSGCGIGLLLLPNKRAESKFVKEYWKNAITSFGEPKEKLLAKLAASPALQNFPPGYLSRPTDPAQAITCFLKQVNATPEQVQRWLQVNGGLNQQLSGQQLTTAMIYRLTPANKFGAKLIQTPFQEFRTVVPTEIPGISALILTNDMIPPDQIGAVLQYAAPTSHQANWQKDLDRTVPFCFEIREGYVVGAEYGSDHIFCSIVKRYDFQQWQHAQPLPPNGFYTYVISVGGAGDVHLDMAESTPTEIGTKHVCILRAVFTRDPSASISAAGEIRVQNGTVTFNLRSGTVMMELYEKTLGTVSSLDGYAIPVPPNAGLAADPLYSLFWIPMVARVLKTALGDPPIRFVEDEFPIKPLTPEFVKSLCNDPAFRDKMYVYDSAKDCARDPRRTKPKGKFCS